MTLDSRHADKTALSTFRTAIQRGTHGLIHNLAIDHYDDAWVVIRGDARSYYGVQLAIHAITQFIGNHRQFSQTQLVLSVDGRRQEYVVARAAEESNDESMSTPGVGRRPELTTAASA